MIVSFQNPEIVTQNYLNLSRFESTKVKPQLFCKPSGEYLNQLIEEINLSCGITDAILQYYNYLFGPTYINEKLTMKWKRQVRKRYIFFHHWYIGNLQKKTFSYKPILRYSSATQLATTNNMFISQNEMENSVTSVRWIVTAAVVVTQNPFG